MGGTFYNGRLPLMFFDLWRQRKRLLAVKRKLAKRELCPFLPISFPVRGNDMACGAAVTVLHTVPRLRRIRNAPPETPAPRRQKANYPSSK